MKILFDTHLLLWSAIRSPRLPKVSAQMLADPSVEPVFSVAALWEIAIKAAKQMPEFPHDTATVRRSLMRAGWSELLIEADHVIAAARLPAIHRDPFDRLMIGQATAEAITLVTADQIVAQYPGPIRRV